MGECPLLSLICTVLCVYMYTEWVWHISLEFSPSESISGLFYILDLQYYKSSVGLFPCVSFEFLFLTVEGHPSYGIYWSSCFHQHQWRRLLVEGHVIGCRYIVYMEVFVHDGLHFPEKYTPSSAVIRLIIAGAQLSTGSQLDLDSLPIICINYMWNL